MVNYLGMRRLVLLVCDKVTLDGSCPAAETRYGLEILDIASKYTDFSPTSNNKGADRLARLRKLVCAFVVRIQEKQQQQKQIRGNWISHDVAGC